MEAYTVADALMLQATALKLVHKKLRALPALAALTSLTSLDLSDNPLTDLGFTAISQQLPALPNLAVLKISGCQLAQLPADLSQLTGLQQLHASANRISRLAESPWACRQLLQVSLGFNHLCSLVSGAIGTSVLAGSSVMALDLSHNDICDLATLLHELQQLPRLQSLHLAGNPVCLLPNYRAEVLRQLPKLLYLDGQKLVSPAGGPARPRPATATATPGSATASATAADAGGSSSATHAVPSVPLLLELSGLEVAEPAERVFADLVAAAASKHEQHLQQLQQHQQGGGCATPQSLPDPQPRRSTQDTASSLAAGGSSGPAPAVAGDACGAVPPPVLRPVIYCLELTLPGGAEVCSLPLTVAAPPAAAAPAEAATGQQQQQQQTAAAAKPGGKGRLVKQDSQALAQASAAAGSRATATPPGASARGVAAAVAGKGRGPAADNPAAAADDAAAGLLPGGQLRMLLRLPVSVAGRDFLRGDGCRVRLLRTVFEPARIVLEQQSAPDATAAAAAVGSAASQPPSAAAAAMATAAAVAAAAKLRAAKAAVPGGKAPPAAATATTALQAADAKPASSNPAASWVYEMKQQLLGTATLSAPQLLAASSSGTPMTAEGRVELRAPVPLFDPATGVRLALRDAALKAAPLAGSCRFRLVLQAAQP